MYLGLSQDFSHREPQSTSLDNFSFLTYRSERMSSKVSGPQASSGLNWASLEP